MLTSEDDFTATSGTFPDLTDGNLLAGPWFKAGFIILSSSKRVQNVVESPASCPTKANSHRNILGEVILFYCTYILPSDLGFWCSHCADSRPVQNVGYSITKDASFKTWQLDKFNR